MRIIHLINSLGVGGAETALLRLCRESKSSGVENTVIYVYGDNSLKKYFLENGIEVFCLASDFLKIIKIKRSDILMAWLPMSHLLSLPLSLLLRPKKIVWNVRQTLNRFEQLSFYTKIFIRLGALFSRFTDAIVYNSSQGNIDHTKLGYHSPILQNIYNGFTIPEDFQNLRIQSRKTLNLSDHDYAVLFVGRDHPDKGVNYFLSAGYEYLKEKQNIKFLMIGKGFESGGARSQEIPPIYKNHFQFLGMKSEKELKAIYSAGDIFTSSSISEGFSNVLGEAMSFGLIPVATDVGDSKNTVADCGFIVEPKSIDMILNAWNKITSLDSEELASKKNKCKERIKNNFSLTATTDNYLKLYNQLVNKNA